MTPSAFFSTTWTAAGAAGFTDDGVPIADEKLLLQALKKCKELDVPISLHEEDPALMRGLEQLPASRQEATQCAMESELVRRHVPKSCLEAYVYEGKK